MKKLRVGFIGAGGMADAHLKGLGNPELFPDIEIAAFCDVVLERAQGQADKYKEHNAVAYDSPAAMVKDAGLDACYILLPPFAHGDAEQACIAGNVPFLVEKPIGIDLGMLREFRDEILQKKLITAAGYMNRYQPSVERAKELFSSDEPVIAYGGWLSGPPTSDHAYFSKALIGKWWVIKEKSGGQMVEQVTHTVDLVRYLMGDAVEVFAHATQTFNKKLPNMLAGYTMDDAMVTSIKFANGGIASIMASVATPVGGGVSLNVLGMKSAAQFGAWAHDVKITRKGDGDNTEETISGTADIFPIEDRIFLDAVRTGDPSKIRSDYADGFKTSQVTLGANESAATGKPVDLTK